MFWCFEGLRCGGKEVILIFSCIGIWSCVGRCFVFWVVLFVLL